MAREIVVRWNAEDDDEVAFHRAVHYLVGAAWMLDAGAQVIQALHVVVSETLKARQHNGHIVGSDPDSHHHQPS
jgi:hypothetical protein